MATTSFTAAPINTSDATFRLWGSQLSAALATVGLINITDTITSATAIGGNGGPTWADITKPTAVDTMQGFEVFRFSDAHQATNPIFVKIEYGSNHTGTSGAIPGIRVTVGRAIDTANGNFVGTTTSGGIIGANTGTAGLAALYDCFISGDTDRINVTMFTGATLAISFFVERFKDDNGATTDTGIDFLGWAGTTAGTYCYHQQLPKVGSAYPSTPFPSPMCAMPYSGQGSWGNNVGLYSIMPNMGWAGNPTMGACMYFTGDIASIGATMTISLYGSDHVFITVGTSNSAAVNGNTSPKSVAMRYE
jgi:hypothetical protein